MIAVFLLAGSLRRISHSASDINLTVYTAERREDMQKSADSEEFRQRLEKLESLFNEKNPLYGIGFDDNILLYKKEVKGKLSPTKTDIYNGIESVFVKNK